MSVLLRSQKHRGFPRAQARVHPRTMARPFALVRAFKVTCIAVLCVTACSRGALEPTPPPPPPEVDHFVEVRGRFCGEPPEEEAFPIKILFVIDQSTSLQCTDSQNRRVRVLNQLVNRLAPQPNIYLGFIGFANWSREQKFTQNPAEMAAYLDPAQGLGPATDYQGALATSLRMLESDMVESARVR